MFILKKIGFILLFLFLETITVLYYINNSEFGREKIINITSLINSYRAEMRSYFNLKENNETLQSDIERLQSYALALEKLIPYEIDSLLKKDTLYSYVISTKIIRNSISRKNNTLTIDKGSKDGVTLDMVATSNGSVLGYVTEISKNLSLVQSILSEKINTSGKLKKNGSICSIFWNGQQANKLSFKEMSKYSEIVSGDTILTTNFSTIFPPDLIIGIVSDIKLINDSYYNGEIILLNDLSKLQYITLIKSEYKKEQKALESKIGD